MARVTVTITEAKNRLTTLIRLLGGGEITITKRDQPTAVIVSWETYRRLQRQAAATRLRELRDALRGSGVDARKIYRESRAQLDGRG